MRNSQTTAKERLAVLRFRVIVWHECGTGGFGGILISRNRRNAESTECEIAKLRNAKLRNAKLAECEIGNSVE